MVLGQMAWYIPQIPANYLKAEIVTFDDLIVVLSLSGKSKENDNKDQLYVIFFLGNEKYIDFRDKVYFKNKTSNTYIPKTI